MEVIIGMLYVKSLTCTPYQGIQLLAYLRVLISLFLSKQITLNVKGLKDNY